MAEENLIAQNALRLAQGLIGMLRDMRGLAYRLDEANARVRKVGRPGAVFPMWVGIRFSGSMSGEYALFLGVETAARLAGLWSKDQGLPDLEAARDESESVIKEVLNSVVGGAIRDLERVAGGLDFQPATIEYREEGRTEQPAAGPWGDLLVLGEAGPVLCCFFLDPRGGGDGT